MAFELRDQVPAVGIPHPRRFVIARGSGEATIGTILRAPDYFPMALELRD